MNAEFLERFIEVAEKDGAYTTKKARPNMDERAFLGAAIENEAHTEIYAVVSAVSNGTEITVVAGPYTLTYTIATGAIAVAKE